jgi:hypothetical protein
MREFMLQKMFQLLHPFIVGTLPCSVLCFGIGPPLLLSPQREQIHSLPLNALVMLQP